MKGTTSFNRAYLIGVPKLPLLKVSDKKKLTFDLSYYIMSTELCSFFHNINVSRNWRKGIYMPKLYKGGKTWKSQ